MYRSGKSARFVLLLWVAVALVCVVSTVLGYLVASVTRGPFEGLVAGLAAVLGFAVAAGLSVTT